MGMGKVSSCEEYFKQLGELLSGAPTLKNLYEIISNAPFYDKFHTTNFDLGMIVFVLANQKSQTIDRISYSHTSPAHDAIRVSPKTFQEIKLPLHHKANLTSQAISTGVPQKTSDWKYLFTPTISDEAARFNQAEAGMACSFIYPVKKGNVSGALIFSFYQQLEVIKEQHCKFMEQYQKLVSDNLR